MSENAPKSHNSEKLVHEQHEVHRETREQQRQNHESGTAETAETAKEKLETLRHEVAEKAVSKDEFVVDQEKDRSNTSQPLINKELKGVMLTRTLARIQKQLSPSQRTFSKVIHSKPVDTISSVGEKTVARPYGILGGASLALLGSIFSTFLSKQFGLNYNLVLFILLFVVGYVVTTCVEGLLRLLNKAK